MTTRLQKARQECFSVDSLSIRADSTPRRAAAEVFFRDSSAGGVHSRPVRGTAKGVTKGGDKATPRVQQRDAEKMSARSNESTRPDAPRQRRVGGKGDDGG